MSSLVAILITLSSLPLRAMNCPIENPKYLAWKDQQSWQVQQVTPSELNPHISYDVFQSQSGEVLLGSLEQGIPTYKASLAIKFKTPEQKSRFAKRCREQKVMSPLKSLETKKRNGQFSIALAILPQLGAKIMNPVAAEAERFAVTLWVAEDSRTKASNFPLSAAEATEQIEKDWQEKIKDMIIDEQSFDGSIVLNFDGNEALACDFLSGKAKARFRHYGQNPSKWSRQDIASFSEVSMIVDKVWATQPQSRSKMFFSAGMVSKEAKLRGHSNSTVVALEPLLLSLFNSVPVKEGGSSTEAIQCAIDQTATFQDNAKPFKNVFEIEILEEL